MISFNAAVRLIFRGSVILFAVSTVPHVWFNWGEGLLLPVMHL